MPHTFVHLQLDPQRTAYWLPQPGQEAAAKILVKSFWALRVNWDGNEDDYAPGFLFVISSKPSPFPLANSSLTLGPKVAEDTDMLWEEPTALRTEEHITTEDELARHPLYLHATPTIPINIYCRPPVKWIHYRLNTWSLKYFIRTAHKLLPLAWDLRRRSKLLRARSGGSECVGDGWSPYDGCEAYIIGGRNDPKTFVFKFLEEPFPTLEGPPTIYEEIKLYRQVCEDYKWAGAESTIDWVTSVRKHPPQVSLECVSTPGVVDSGRPRSPQEADPSWRGDALLLLSIRYPPLEPEPVDYNSDTASEFVTHSFPRLPFEYSPMISPMRIRIVVFDLFGVILDREGAIREALTPWTLVCGHTKDATQLARLYLESEALINHSSATQPMSLACIVHSALLELSKRLGLHISPRSSLFSDTMAHILIPPVFPDVEPAISALVDRGVKLVCFQPHSSTTMGHYERVLPRAFREHVALAPLPIPVHFAVRDDPWWRMYAKCKEVAPDVRYEEILILSAGMGRVLVPAIDRECATALLKRCDGLEGNVAFAIGERPEHVPTPSMTVRGLMELCGVLDSL